MNIVQLQEALKDFSDDQLVREMQAPSGQAPQYLVLTELERREKSRQRYQAQQQPQQSVAEEALMTRMQGGIAPMAPQGMPPQSANAPSSMAPPMQPPMQMAQGGVVKARDGMYMPTDPLLRAIMMQESGGDPMARGAAGEVGAFQIMPTTALQPGFGIPTLFPELAAQIGPNKQFATPQEAYEANKDIIDAVLQDPRQSEQFASSYIDAARQRFPGDEARAIAAYNVGMGGAEKLENPLGFPYVEGVASQGYSPEELKTPPSIPGISAAQASTNQSPRSGGIYGNTSLSSMGSDLMDFFRTGDSQSGIAQMAEENRQKMIQAGLYTRTGGDDTAGEAEGQAMMQRRQQRLAQLEQQVASGNPLTVGVIVDEFISDPDPEVRKRAEEIRGAYQEQQQQAPVAAETVTAPRPEGTPQPQNVAPRTPAEGPSVTQPEDKTKAATDTTQPQVDEASLYDIGEAPETETTAEQPKSALDRYMDMLQEQRASAEKQAEMDRYLALAQAGATLASSKDPTFLGALGEATGAGIDALRGARKPISDIQEAERDFMKSLAVAEASAESKGATTQREYLRLAKDYDKMIADLQGDIIGSPTPEQAQRLQEALSMRDYYRTLGGLPPMAPTGGVSGLSVDAIAAELAKRQQ